MKKGQIKLIVEDKEIFFNFDEYKKLKEFNKEKEKYLFENWHKWIYNMKDNEFENWMATHANEAAQGGVAFDKIIKSILSNNNKEMKLQLDVNDFYMVNGQFNLTYQGVRKYYRYIVMQIEKHVDDHIEGNIGTEELHKNIHEMLKPLVTNASWLDKFHENHADRMKKSLAELGTSFKFPNSLLKIPLSCPFCNGDPEIYPEDPKTQGNAWATVTCKNVDCDADFSVHYKDDDVEDWDSIDYKNAAIDKWNNLITKINK